MHILLEFAYILRICFQCIYIDLRRLRPNLTCVDLNIRLASAKHMAAPQLCRSSSFKCGQKGNPLQLKPQRGAAVLNTATQSGGFNNPSGELSFTFVYVIFISLVA